MITCFSPCHCRDFRDGAETFYHPGHKPPLCPFHNKINPLVPPSHPVHDFALCVGWLGGQLSQRLKRSFWKSVACSKGNPHEAVWISLLKWKVAREIVQVSVLGLSSFHCSYVHCKLLYYYSNITFEVMEKPIRKQANKANCQHPSFQQKSGTASFFILILSFSDHQSVSQVQIHSHFGTGSVCLASCLTIFVYLCFSVCLCSILLDVCCSDLVVSPPFCYQLGTTRPEMFLT